MSNDATYQLTLSNGRVMDPESGLDAIRNLGVAEGVVQAISAGPLRGDDEIDASGLVVSPGFIDLNTHGQDTENYELQALDGVTTALELEGGAVDVDRWYAEREGKTAINYGPSVGHMPTRASVLGSSGGAMIAGDAAHRPSTEAEIEEINRYIERGLEQGALAVGLGLQYTPGASRLEVQEVFKRAAPYNAPCYVHMRGMGHQEPMNSVEGLQELIAAAAVTGAPLHLTHVHSSGLRATSHLLRMIEGARARGIDVTTDCYPYTAALTGIESAIFDEGWQRVLGIGYEELEWTQTGERLTSSTFPQYREQGGRVIMHMIPEEAVNEAMASPIVLIASDGVLEDGKGHPRTAGSYSRVLGRFVREAGVLTLMEALRKMTLMPAQRLEGRAPIMKNKGRVRVGADADLTLFDPESVIDRATFERPTLPSEGILHVVVNGETVVRDGELQAGSTPGRGVRAL